MIDDLPNQFQGKNNTSPISFNEAFMDLDLHRSARNSVGTKIQKITKNLALAFGSLLLIYLAFSGCATHIEKYSPYENIISFEDLKNLLLSEKVKLSTFEDDGPFQFEELQNFNIRVSQSEVVDTNVYLSSHEDSAPLVIIQHGNRANKNVHQNQARRLATWGFHVLVTSLPNTGKWLQNCETVEYLVNILHRWPNLLAKKFDRNRIILAGHSFGGSVVGMVAGQNAPIRGVIFMDPALVDPKVSKYLKKITVPTILIGADRRVFKSKSRDQFYRLIPSDAMEVSIKNATHNDAQSPSLFSIPQFFGFEKATSAKNQSKFQAALVSSAFSLSTTGDYSFAWNSFKSALKDGTLFRAKKK